MTSELSNFASRLRDVFSFQEIDPRRFNSLALELFALQFAHNAPYRKICEARRVTPLTINDWSQIPAVPTTAFKELDLTCLPPAERTHFFQSSGTTEQRRSRHFHSGESLAVYEASLLNWFRHQFNLTSQLLALTPPPAQATNSSLVHMFDVVRQNFRAQDVFVGSLDVDGAWTLDFDKVLQRLRAIVETNQPCLLLGTAFSFVHLLDFLSEQNLRLQLPFGSRVMETGGYKGRSRTLPKAELHALITDRLGVPRSEIVCEYGMSELSSQAYDTPLLNAPGVRHFHFPPWARVQIVSPETGREVADGETGLIRLFDLANVFSVLAIQTEDLAIRRGNGFELLGRAVAAEPRGCSLMAV